MLHPDGVDYQNEHIFVEIVKPGRIVLRHISGPRFHLRAAPGAKLTPLDGSKSSRGTGL
jgi:hypothetical protein